MKTEKKPLYKRPIIFIPTIIFIVLCILNIWFVGLIVNGPSMTPTLTDGSIKFGFRHFTIDRFIIVAIDSEKYSKYLVKRVIGLPNETIEYKDNLLYINGEMVLDNYNFGTTEDFIITLKDNEYFCLGDNRNNSADSRTYGPFTSDDIFAKIIE